MTVLDSSFIIDYWEGEPYAKTFLGGLSDTEPVWVPTLVLYELYAGALLSDSPADTITSVATDLDWADPLPFDDGAAREAADIRADLSQRGEPINPVDMLIAGIARDASMTLVACDDHFDRVADLDHYNPANGEQ
jgi:predicted nucleic acid-binding protein